MKNLIILLLFFVSSFSYSQVEVVRGKPLLQYNVTSNDTVYSFVASTILEKPLNDFLKNSYKNGLDMSRFEDLKFVFYLETKDFFPKDKEDIGGTYMNSSSKDYIVLNENRLPHYLPTLIEAVVYHEMFHFILEIGSHCFAGECPKILRDGSQINFEELIHEWGPESKKEYFEYMLFQQKSQRELLGEPKGQMKTYRNVIATVYNAVPEQTNSDPSHTAFMFKLDLNNPYKHRLIAVSRDLLEQYPKGTKVNVSGTSYDGIYTVMDKMNKRYKNRIDILINEDMPIGIWKDAKITKVK